MLLRACDCYKVYCKHNPFRFGYTSLPFTRRIKIAFDIFCLVIDPPTKGQQHFTRRIRLLIVFYVLIGKPKQFDWFVI